MTDRSGDNADRDHGVAHRLVGAATAQVPRQPPHTTRPRRLRPVIDMAHAVGARVLVDGAQAVPHMKVDVRALDADFYVFSGHKLFGPTGIGALYGKRALLEDMPPWQGGGGMIDQVTFERTTYAPLPSRFEAGTGHIAGAVGLGAAIDYVNRVGLQDITGHEARLIEHGTQPDPVLSSRRWASRWA